MQSTGLSPADYKKEIREEMTLQQIQQQAVGPKVTITPQELNDFIRSKAWETDNEKEYQLQDILIPLPENPSNEKFNKPKQKPIKFSLKYAKNGIDSLSAGENDTWQQEDLGWRKLQKFLLLLPLLLQR